MAGQRSNMFSVSALSDRHAKDLARALGLNPKDKPMLDKIKKNLDKAVKNLVSTAGDYDGILKELNHAIDSYDTKGFQPKSLPEMRKLQEELTQITTTMTKLSKNQNVGDSSLAALSPLMVKVAASIEGIKAGQWGNLALQRTMQEKGLGEKTNPKAVEGIYKKNSDLINKDFKKFIRDNSNLLQSKSYQSGMLKVVTAGLLGPAAVLTEPLVEFVEEQKGLFKDNRRLAKEKKKQDAEGKKNTEAGCEERAQAYERLAELLTEDEKRAYPVPGAGSQASMSAADQADLFRSDNAFALGADGIDATSADDFIYKSKEERKKMFKVENKQRQLLQEIVDLLAAQGEVLEEIESKTEGGGSDLPLIAGGAGIASLLRFVPVVAAATVAIGGAAAAIQAIASVMNGGDGKNFISEMIPKEWKEEDQKVIGKIDQGYQATKNFFKDAVGLNTVGDVLSDASEATGTNYNTLATFASIESGFDPNAQNARSSAGGLFQFTDSTWKDYVGKYGEKYGIGIEDKMDPRANAIMGGMLLKDNSAILSAKGIPVDEASLYLAHFMGPTGAARFLKHVQNDPEGSAVMAAGTKVASANPDIFYGPGRKPRSNKEVLNILYNKTAKHAKAGSAAMAMSLGGGSNRAGVGDTMGAVPSYATPPAASGSAMKPSANTRATPIPPPQANTSSAGAYAPTGSSTSKDFGSTVNIDTIPMYVDDTGLIMVTMGGMV